MAKVTIVIEDTDLDTGQFTFNIDVEGSKIDDGQMTAAHLTAAYFRNQIQTEAWHRGVWAFAQLLVAQQPGASIANLGQTPEGMSDIGPGAIDKAA